MGDAHLDAHLPAGESLEIILREASLGTLKGAAPPLGELARKLPAFWKSLPIEAKEKLHALALALPPLPENHPAHAFTETVLDLVEREHPAHARLLEEAVESALEGRGVPWQTSQLGAFLKEQEEAP